MVEGSGTSIHDCGIAVKNGVISYYFRRQIHRSSDSTCKKIRKARVQAGEGVSRYCSCGPHFLGAPIQSRHRTSPTPKSSSQFMQKNSHTSTPNSLPKHPKMTSIQGKKALLLGSGFVATPTVEVLAKAGVHVTVACRTLVNAQKLSGGFSNTSAVSLDVSNAAALEKAIGEHDVVISLIPYTFHADVIKAAIKTKKHVVSHSDVWNLWRC